MVAVAGVAGGLTASEAVAAVDPEPVRCSELTWNLIEVQLDSLVVDVDCSMFRAVVLGDVTVLPGAAFQMVQSHVQGSIRTEGAVHVVESTVEGDVVLDGFDTASLDVWPIEGGPSTVHGDVVGLATDVRIGEGTVWGTYDVTVRDATRIRSTARMVGPVTARGGRLLVHDATFLGGLTALDTGDSIVCRSTVAGELRVSGLTGYAQLGVENGVPCEVVVSGSLVLEDNPHSVDLGRVQVAGDLVCEGNTGPRGVTEPGGYTQVYGGRTGECLR